MIFSLLIIHNYDRRSSITRVLHVETWKYFASNLPNNLSLSPKVVKEAIMTDVYDLVQEFWRTSTDEVNVESIFAMRCLYGILGMCSDVCVSLANSIDLADKI